MRRRFDAAPLVAPKPSYVHALREDFEHRVRAQFEDQQASLQAIDLLIGSLDCSFEEGCRLEEATYERLFSGEASRSLRLRAAVKAVGEPSHARR